MKFKHSLITLIAFFAIVCIDCTHADGDYDAPVLMEYLKQKLGNIQQEYKKLRQKKDLQYLWNIGGTGGKNSRLECCGKSVQSIQDFEECMEDLRFSSLTLKEQNSIRTFMAVLMSEDFLRMLLGGNASVNLINGLKSTVTISHNGTSTIQTAFLKFSDIQISESSMIFSLQVHHSQMSHYVSGGENGSTFLDITLAFTFDIEKNNIQFIGLKFPVTICCLSVKKEDMQGLPILSKSFFDSEAE